MKILTVIPIQSAARIETLTYFTRAEVSPGDLVSVPIRSRLIPALVIEANEVSAEKGDIKKLAFSLKKIDRVLGESALSIGVIRAIEKTALFHASSVGNILSEVMPGDAFEGIKKETVAQNKKNHEVIRVQASEEERIAYYKNMIRDSFANKKDILCVAPTIEDVLRLSASLSHGIKDRTFVLGSHLSKKKKQSVYQAILKHKDPILLITTPGSSLVPGFSPRTIICEREASRAWHTFTRPFLDARIFLAHLAMETGATLVWGDTLLRYSTFKNTPPHLHDFIRLTFEKQGSISLVNMADVKRVHEQEEIISPHLREAIQKSLSLGEHVFLFSARKGYAPSTVCRDCARIVTCNTCGGTLILQNKPEGRVFGCSRCNTNIPAYDMCPGCSGHRLMLLGIGTEKVSEVAAQTFPETKTFVCDGSVLTTRKQVRDIIQSWKETPGSILIGTELALLSLPEKIDTIGVISFDPLLSLPDFEIEEKIAHSVLSFIHKTTRSVIVQTRRAEHPIWQEILSGNIKGFFSRIGDERIRLGLPPHSTFILLRTLGTRVALEQTLSQMKELFTKEMLHILPRKTRGNKEILSILIQKKDGEWPDEALSEKLRRLPPSWQIEVSPKDIL